MAIIIETGAIVAGAESYISAADATTYHTARGNTSWTGTDAVKEAALRKAASYLDGHYRNRWKGCKVRPVPSDGLDTQSMEWPRDYVEISGYLFPFDEIPQRIKDAQCELALIALSADLAPSVAAGVKREKLDVLETEYFAGAPAGTTVYTAVNNLLADLLKPLNACDAVRG